jgi:hypothetical protein
MCESFGRDQAVVPNQRFARSLDSFLAIGGERDVAAARVSPIERPFGLAVADYETPWSWHAVPYCWSS